MKNNNFRDAYDQNYIELRIDSLYSDLMNDFLLRFTDKTIYNLKFFAEVKMKRNTDGTIIYDYDQETLDLIQEYEKFKKHRVESIMSKYDKPTRDTFESFSI